MRPSVGYVRTKLESQWLRIRAVEVLVPCEMFVGGEGC